MKKTSQFLKILGCLCILVSCCLFGYSQYLKKAQKSRIEKLYKQTVQLIPDTYVPSSNANLDVDGYDIKAVVTGNSLHLVISTSEELPHYKKGNIYIPETYLKDIEKLRSGDIVTIKTISGKILKYQLEVIGYVDQLSKTKDLVFYTYTNSKYYCINAIRVS